MIDRMSDNTLNTIEYIQLHCSILVPYAMVPIEVLWLSIVDEPFNLQDQTNTEKRMTQISIV